MSKILRDKKTIYLLSFIIPFAVFMAIMAALGLFPFSDNTILFSDMNNQFVSFFTWFKNLHNSNNNLIYSFSKNLGGDMIGFSAYYLQNPFLLILFLFPDKYMPLGIYLMEALMLSTAGLTFQIFITNTFKKSSIIFSTSYALMGYSLAYFMLPIYYCNIILLPLVIMGLYIIMGENNKIKHGLLYIITLCFSIICNYYLGYMLCLFLVLYFVYLCIVKYDEEKSSDINFIKFSINKLGIFASYSVIAVMLSCVDLVPVALSLRGQKNAPDTSIMSLGRMFRLVSLYRSVLPGTYNGDISNQSLPYIYVGIIPVLFILLYLINNKISITKRIAALLLMGAMVLCLYIRPLNVIWHAFNEPVGFAHRFAFYLSFVMIVIGYQGYLYVSDLQISLKEKKVCVNTAALVVLCAVAILELSYNAYHSMKVNVLSSKSQSDYEAFLGKVEPVIEGVKALETKQSLYRFEKDFLNNMEDPMTFDYAGLSHNSSCETDRVKQFMGNMGLRNQGIWAFYNQGSTAFTDSFLGVKYFASRFDTTDKMYSPLFNTEDTWVFENENVLPFAFIADADKIQEVDINTKDLFSIQNSIAKAFDYDDDIYSEAQINEIRVCGDIVVPDEFKDHAESGNSSIVYINKTESDEISYVEFDVLVSESGRNLYFYFSAPNKQGARIYVNGIDWDDYFSDWRWAIEKAGMFPGGDTVTVRIESTADEITVNDYYIYEEDLNKLADWRGCAANLGADSVSLEKISSSHIKGEFNASKSGKLVFSIPYEKGWKIKIDGNSVKQTEVLGALMSIDVSEGYHNIEMKYIPEGILVGTLISLTSLIILLVLLFTQNKKDVSEKIM